MENTGRQVRELGGCFTALNRVRGLVASGLLVAVAGCAAPTLPGYIGPQDGLGLIGVSSYAGQERIYQIASINGQETPPANGIGIKVPPGEYAVVYRWGRWGARTLESYAHTYVKVRAGMCYQPWFIERQLPDERVSTGEMICWNRFTANGDGTYSPSRVCEPAFGMRRPVESTLMMNEFPIGHELCEKI